MMAFVFGVIFGSIVSAEMFCESRSTSANTGVQPRTTAQLAEAMNERGLTITSSPGPTPSAIRASSRATVPLARAIACFTPSFCVLTLELSTLLARPVVHLAGLQDAIYGFTFFSSKHGQGPKLGDIRLFTRELGDKIVFTFLGSG